MDSYCGRCAPDLARRRDEPAPAWEVVRDICKRHGLASVPGDIAPRPERNPSGWATTLFDDIVAALHEALTDRRAAQGAGERGSDPCDCGSGLRKRYCSTCALRVTGAGERGDARAVAMGALRDAIRVMTGIEHNVTLMAQSSFYPENQAAAHDFLQTLYQLVEIEKELKPAAALPPAPGERVGVEAAVRAGDPCGWCGVRWPHRHKSGCYETLLSTMKTERYNAICALEPIVQNLRETASRHALASDPQWAEVRAYAERLAPALTVVLTALKALPPPAGTEGEES